MRVWIAVALVLAGCKDKPKPPPTGSAARSDAGVAIKIDWAKCDKALAKAQTAPLDARPQLVIDGCHVCGDWKPILGWSTPQKEGGPKPEQIEAAMTACNAFCSGDAKMKFMGALDKARGTNSRAPWRQLAQSCSGFDERFVSAPYFALDRIARAATAHGGDTQTKLAALELPLPALTSSGEGPVLPDVEGVSPKVGELQITLLGDTIFVGRMPRAKLGDKGLQVALGEAGYPGETVALKSLGRKLLELVGDDKTQTITLLAPHAMPAQKLVPVVAAASAVAPVYLAANAVESPEGWQLVGALPIALEAGGGKPIAITPEMSVANLAAELAKHVAQKQPRIGLTTK